MPLLPPPPPAVTAGDIILAALQEIGAIGIGEPLPAADASTGATNCASGLPGLNVTCELDTINTATSAPPAPVVKSTTIATFTNFGTTFAATNWTNSDVLQVNCFAY